MLACRLARFGKIGWLFNQQGKRKMETLIGSALVFFILLVATFNIKKRRAKQCCRAVQAKNSALIASPNRTVKN